MQNPVLSCVYAFIGREFMKFIKGDMNGKLFLTEYEYIISQVNIMTDHEHITPKDQKQALSDLVQFKEFLTD